ncbi:hypothetical protein C8J42_101191 [Sphingomonas sp. PP-CE-1A-559]|nr:hypothetical protein C8J42_101191 [Sphingomonas sp. PP-CE-1A-559]
MRPSPLKARLRPRYARRGAALRHGAGVRLQVEFVRQGRTKPSHECLARRSQCLGYRYKLEYVEPSL